MNRRIHQPCGGGTMGTDTNISRSGCVSGGKNSLKKTYAVFI
jgi:hypothetical protein